MNFSVTMVLVNLYPWYRKEHPFLEYEKKNPLEAGILNLESH